VRTARRRGRNVLGHVHEPERPVLAQRHGYGNRPGEPGLVDQGHRQRDPRGDHGPDPIELRGANRVTVDSGAAFELRAGSTASLQSGAGFAVRGSTVDINGVGCRPAARAGDPVAGGSIVSGSTTVCIG